MRERVEAARDAGTDVAFLGANALYWRVRLEQGTLGEPTSFINPTPHMTFVRGEENVDYLRRRYELLKTQPLFADIEFSDDPAVIAEWAPLLIDRRDKGEAIAATRSVSGTDVDFGSVTRQLFDKLVENGAAMHLGHRVRVVRHLVQVGGHALELAAHVAQRRHRLLEVARVDLAGRHGTERGVQEQLGHRRARVRRTRLEHRAFIG